MGYMGGFHLQDSPTLNMQKHSKGSRNDEKEGARLRIWIRDLELRHYFGKWSVTLITCKKGETKGVRLLNSKMRLYCHTNQITFLLNVKKISLMPLEFQGLK